MHDIKESENRLQRETRIGPQANRLPTKPRQTLAGHVRQRLVEVTNIIPTKETHPSTLHGQVHLELALRHIEQSESLTACMVVSAMHFLPRRHLFEQARSCAEADRRCRFRSPKIAVAATVSMAAHRLPDETILILIALCSEGTHPRRPPCLAFGPAAIAQHVACYMQKLLAALGCGPPASPIFVKIEKVPPETDK